MFDFHTSAVYKAIRYPMRIIVPTQILFGMFFVLFLLLYFFPGGQARPGGLSENQTLGILLMLTSVNTWCTLYWLFYLLRLKKVHTPRALAEADAFIQKGGDINFADFIDLDAGRVLWQGTLWAKKHSAALSATALLFALISHRRADFVFSRLLIHKQDFEKTVEVIVSSQYKLKPGERMLGDEFMAVMRVALSDAASRGDQAIGFSHVLSAVVSVDKTIQRLFFDFGVRKEDVLEVARWGREYHTEHEQLRPFLENFTYVKGLADDWMFGYTPTLNSYGKEMAVRAVESEAHMHILGREEETSEVETILSRSGKNNVVLVGESGVGKTAVALGFAQRIFYGTTKPELMHKRVFELDVNLMLSRARDQASSIALFDKVLLECKRAGNVILVIDNIQNVVGPQRKEEVGAVDVSSILIPYLQSDRFQLIALTDHASYHSQIERVPSLGTLFEKVEVRELDEAQTLGILEDITPKLERINKLFISYYALAETVAAAGSFIQNVPFPEKAISLLTETLAYVSGHKLYGNVVTQDHVTEVVSKKTGIPLGRIEGEEKAKLLNLEKLIHQRIVGQEEAIGQISAALRRIRSGITERKRPIGTFLFLGPTGVGKTETSKALAAVYFGSEERMIRLDMTEYQSAESLNRLIGNIDTDTPAQFADMIRENPFSIVVLDELEKSHPNVQNLFLQVLDEGRLTDAFQKKVSFRNTIIIATSNAGSEFIREYVKTGQDMRVVQTRLFEYLLRNHVFKPEFLNRFDAVIVFKPLTPEEVKQIAEMMLGNLRVRLEEKGYLLEYGDEVLKRIAEKGYDADFGARELRRLVQESVEGRIADQIIKGEYKQGDTIKLDDVVI